ncbi:D-hexose-6-phosphate mutarotase [Nevskia sp.]|uniref:D-hexose-6-phosphate mutarotase n=1 Tax=Nevskia sp. TaxID=1929292 RepID=UPI0025F0E3BD|nr:D-hexose-6-phosphate mutarotase [Nevskia sp.]
MNDTDPSAAILNFVTADGARMTVHRHGAHVTSWTPVDGRERLFLSGRSDYRPTAAIRGGIPVIFPQFAAEGPLPKHGFARTARWSQVDAAAVDGGAFVVRFRLVDDAATRALWPQAFAAELRVLFGGTRLAVSLSVLNSGDSAFAFTAALHSYLAVEAVDTVRVLGLDRLRYRDTAGGGVEHVESAEEVAIIGEVDRIYFDAPQELLMREPTGDLRIQQSGFSDTVVWNPGPAKAALLADLDPGGWQRFLCIEAAAVGRPVRLQPGERWVGTQTLIA